MENMGKTKSVTLSLDIPHTDCTIDYILNVTKTYVWIVSKGTRLGLYHIKLFTKFIISNLPNI